MDIKGIPCIGTEEMIEVDRLMVEEYGIELIQMMENAGRQLARLGTKRFLNGNPQGKKVAVLAGSGGNGGGALACARNLHNWGAEVAAVLSKSTASYSGVIRKQVEILESLSVELHSLDGLAGVETPDLVIDGIIGYNLGGAPLGSAAEMVCWANRQKCPILALDVPSGLDATSGKVYQPVIHASATMTLVLPKTGFQEAPEDIVGELYLADIGVPPGLFAHPSLNLQIGPIFHQGEIILLSDSTG